MALTTREAGSVLNTSARVVHALVEAGLLRYERTSRGMVLITETEQSLQRLALTPEEIVRLVRAKKDTLLARPPKEHSDGNTTVR